MSRQGKLIRGMKWNSLRGKDGSLPKGVENDQEKMKDVNFYLDYLKDKDEEKVKVVLNKIRHLGRMAGRSVEYKEQVNFLDNAELKVKKKGGK